VESHHWSQTRLADGTVITGTPLGFVVEPEPGVRIYHTGDTAIFGDMKLIGRLHQPTVGLIGCTQPWPLVPRFSPGPGRLLTGEMSAAEAAIAAELLGVRIAVASHYVDPEDEDVQTFLDLVRGEDTTGQRSALAIRAGEILVIDGEAFRVDSPS
jgi:L-ascorbate metabolism protein UlaG (beta-lactamase superfamily)